MKIVLAAVPVFGGKNIIYLKCRSITVRPADIENCVEEETAMKKRNPILGLICLLILAGIGVYIF